MTKKWLVPVFLFLLSLYIFTWGLGNISLMPWDEAWYATISRNIVRSSDWLHLTFADQPYYDHPPLGFYSIATSFALLGVNEFSARLPMAIFGSLAVVVVYLTGKKMGGTWTGLAAGLVLLSCRWFIFRSRTANLEALLLLTQILAIYFWSKPTKWWQVSLGWFSLALALLTKSVISVTLIPLGLWSTFNFIRSYRQTAKTIIVSGLLLIVPLLPWYGANYLRHGQGFINQSIKIAVRGGAQETVTWATTTKTLLYLRSAIHKWYLPLLASIVVAIFFIRRQPTRWLVAYLFLASFPYFLSARTEIWHLLPILPPAALLIAYVSFSLPLPSKLVLAGFLGLFAISYTSYWPEFIHLAPYTIFEAKIGLAAHQNNLPVVTQETTYVPTLVFYADLPLKVSPIEYDLTDYPRPFQLITHTYLLSPQRNYRITHQEGDTVVAVFD
ncbi:MAG: glycosyltransferase family 39 protein [bacterium]|nr:glycosyltransferase family 39 protein [bacterium]